MSSRAIELEGVGKRYRLGEHHGTGTDLRETLARMSRRLRGLPKEQVRDFWSLRDVSFAVDEGSAVGIIGSNGAGKSTLLKVISNITTPTEGQCRTRGRIGSLLEVGTGFHGELTGIENTYLNGAILGMSRQEVNNRLDEIVEFAGLAPFMDTPVKRYSSGMYLRLGFSIAAHMEADILLVDEVLAVGDVEFQRRCLGKMDEVEKSGRTVLFVSHNMDAMVRLCPESLWLDKGRVRSFGPTTQVVAEYMSASGSTSGSSGTSLEIDPTTSAQVVEVAVVDEEGVPQATLNTRSGAWIQVDIMVNELRPGTDVSYQLKTASGVLILDEALSDVTAGSLSDIGRYRVVARLPPILTPGDYTIGIWLGSAYEDLEQHDNLVAFSVDGDDSGRPRRLIKLSTEWRISRLDEPPFVADGRTGSVRPGDAPVER